MRLYDNDTYRDDFMSIVYDLLSDDPTNYRANQIIDAFDNAPEIDAAPIKHGKWVKTDYKPMIFTKCSLCGHRVEIQNKSTFCPGCGAEMTNSKQQTPVQIEGMCGDSAQQTF